ncbi:MAG: hypothetical protein Q8L60_11085 [Gammaproteobacteria bacterium]|nr:hypothetical protein [Gammaproteobacteria bacterium]MDP2140865.1 hypothetical protein [Gammaproteobacteria bacterium]MDP2349392.1 hypothetical protein [Gammaproteobacteria bacterium]
MLKNNQIVIRLLLGIVLVAMNSVISANAQTPPPRPLGLNTPTGLPVFPIMEGAYENADGSFTVSFGYHNRNSDQALDIPIGPNNFLEPEQFNGMQPTHFINGRATGVFTVTVPASMREQSIWWNIRTGNGELLRVPGRFGRLGYTLDRNPRPQGTLAPQASFVAGGMQGTDPMGLVAENTLTVAVGAPLTLTLHAEDPSVRNANDPRFDKPIPVRVSWYKHQGVGAVTFSRHESTPAPDTQGPGARLEPNQVQLPEGRGVANVVATFSAPGEYMIRGTVDNWTAPDSSEGNQCCWTNMYHRVSVTP